MYKIPAIPLFLGKNLIFMPECHSTNNVMLLLCQNETIPEGSLIITANQTAGRGQRGNSWEAEPGKNLTFSFLIRPVFLPVHQQFYLNMVVSLGIRDYLTGLDIGKVQIKWPNDILADGKKICGILIENQISGSSFANCVVGVGLNINQQQFHVPNATSVHQLCGRVTDLSEALDKLMHCLEIRYLQLKNGKFEMLRDDYLQNLFRLNIPARFADDHSEFTGSITGVDATGRLLVLVSDEIRSYNLKQIRFLGSSADLV